jgi:hypothetical protein
MRLATRRQRDNKVRSRECAGIRVSRARAKVNQRKEFARRESPAKVIAANFSRIPYSPLAQAGFFIFKNREQGTDVPAPIFEENQANRTVPAGPF